ncbi:MAG: outer membrane beta-barrel protein [Verrucomicrobiota bacterium JB023]|nr:outer membrane beta-barrel protein [Verrucomicrobiota bacterium JB023]
MITTKHLLPLTLIPFSLQAGETTYVAPTQPQPMITSEMSDLDWLLGGSVGFLLDAEEEHYSLQFGKEFAANGPWTHSAYLEVGYSDLENDGNELDLEDAFNFSPGDSFTGDANIEATFIPVTLNYKVDYHFTPKFSVYATGGLGAAFIDVDGEFEDSFSSIDDDGNDTDVSFFAQAGAGVNYEISEAFEMFAGARYMFIDDYSVTVDSGTVDVDENDDVLLEVGGRFRF